MLTEGRRAELIAENDAILNQDSLNVGAITTLLGNTVELFGREPKNGVSDTPFFIDKEKGVAIKIVTTDSDSGSTISMRPAWYASEDPELVARILEKQKRPHLVESYDVVSSPHRIHGVYGHSTIVYPGKPPRTYIVDTYSGLHVTAGMSKRTETVPSFGVPAHQLKPLGEGVWRAAQGALSLGT